MSVTAFCDCSTSGEGRGRPSADEENVSVTSHHEEEYKYIPGQFGVDFLWIWSGFGVDSLWIFARLTDYFAVKVSLTWIGAVSCASEAVGLESMSVGCGPFWWICGDPN